MNMMNCYNINQISYLIFLNIQNFKHNYIKKKIQKKKIYVKKFIKLIIK